MSGAGREESPAAVWLDLGYDRDYASDGRSRYGSYLRDRARWWADDDPDYDDAVRLQVASAARCWQIANGPIMAPGLVRLHPRVLQVIVAADEFDGLSLVVAAEVVSALPDRLGTVLGSGWRGWERGVWEGSAWTEPYDRSGQPVRMALPTLRLCWPISPAPLPPHPGGGVPAAGEGIAAVAVIAESVNRELRPVLSGVDGSA